MYSKAIDREERLRRKLVNNELNPIADAILSIVLLTVTPFIYFFSLLHDKLMFKFLNRTYIYNVSWEVSFFLHARPCPCRHLLLYSSPRSAACAYSS